MDCRDQDDPMIWNVTNLAFILSLASRNNFLKKNRIWGLCYCLLKCCSQYASRFEKQQWLQDWKRSVFIPILKKSNAKECSNYHTVMLISHASKVMLKSFKLGFNSIWTENFQMYKLDFEKTEEPEIKLPISAGSWKKQESSRKTSTSASLTTLKSLTV